MSHRTPRLAARAIIVQDSRLLLVNAYRAAVKSELWCAPGGGVKPGQSLPDNLRREVREETGFDVAVNELALVNEFHDPSSGFHQVDLFFRCTVLAGNHRPDWVDPEGVVTTNRFFSAVELAGLHLKPNSLPSVAFNSTGSVHYDPLERLVL